MSTAVAAAAAWRQVPAPKRGEAVRLMGEELRRYKDALGSLVSMENGKIKAEGDGEVQEMIDIDDFAVGQSRMLYGLTMHSERPQHRMYEQWHPLGIVGVISAFNFPVAVWSWNAFLAAISGNATVWKPSPKTALCSLAVQHICNRALERHALPPISQIFIAPATDLAQRFVDDRRVALVSFTGSTHVGRRIGVKVAERLGKSLLELGGNNAIIVDDSANLDLAVPGIVFGAVGTAGQRCTTTRRVLVHRSRAAELERRLVAAYAQVRIGDPLNGDTLMGPLIDAGAVSRYSAAIAAALAEGGELLCGGKVLARPGNFVEPTIIRAHAGMEVVRTETFAPILYLIAYAGRGRWPFKTVPYGLLGGVHRPAASGGALPSAEGSDCGIANVNLGTSGARSAALSAARRTPAAAACSDSGRHAAPDQHHQLEFALPRSGDPLQRLINSRFRRLAPRAAPPRSDQVLSSCAWRHPYSSIQFRRSSSSGIQRSSAPSSRQRPVALRPAAKFARRCAAIRARRARAARCQRRASALQVARH